MESCPECGEDVRPRCSQGHASRAGERFCEICGEFLPLVQSGQAVAVAAAAPALDYSSGSFADFIAGNDDDHASLAVPVLPEAPWEPEPATWEPEPEPAALEPGPPPCDPVASEPGPAEPSLWEPVAREPSPARAEPQLDFAEPVASEAEPAGAGPKVGEGPSRTGATQPFDRSLTFPSSSARPTPGTWRSSAKPKDRPGPDGGVHHDVTPRMPGADELATPVPALQRPRRTRVIVVVALVAVLGAGGTAGALALHRHYAAGITSPARHVAGANPATSAGTGSASPAAPSSAGYPVPPRRCATRWTAPEPSCPPPRPAAGSRWSRTLPPGSWPSPAPRNSPASRWTIRATRSPWPTGPGAAQPSWIPVPARSPDCHVPTQRSAWPSTAAVRPTPTPRPAGSSSPWIPSAA